MGAAYLFFEDYRFASEKGVISCCEVDSEGNCSEPRVVLERNISSLVSVPVYLARGALHDPRNS